MSAITQADRDSGILIDTNIAVLLVVGSVDSSRIERFKRTAQFTVEDFILLRTLCDQFSRIVITPHVLTEVSNVAIPAGPDLLRVRHSIRDYVLSAFEVRTPAEEIVSDKGYLRLGVADASVLGVTADGVFVLTDDVDLYLELSRRGLRCSNFNHLRSARWA